MPRLIIGSLFCRGSYFILARQPRAVSSCLSFHVARYPRQTVERTRCAMSQPLSRRFMGILQGIFGKRAPPPIPPPVDRRDESDIEELLARLCRPASATNSAVIRSVSVQRCNEISDILLNKGKSNGDERLLAWSERPRIYFVLRNIQRLDLLDNFVKAELTDFHIPFNEDTLPAFLCENGLRESFLRFQPYVLSSGAKGLDNHGEPHLSFAGDAQRYFYYKGSLGRGGYG